jgi:hypothetical protein
MERALRQPVLVLRVPSSVAVMLAVAGLYLLVSIGAFVLASPFSKAIEEAGARGGWSRADVQFVRGSYTYGVLGSNVEADVRVLLPGETRAAHIELSHSLFAGWTVRDFRTRGSEAVR